MISYDRTRDCMCREENGCSANICHTIFVEVEWTVKSKRYHTWVKQLLKNKANVPHRLKLFERIYSKPHAKNYCRVGQHPFRIHRGGRSTTGSTVDRLLLTTKWMLPNSTIVLSMWFSIRSSSFTVWDISFILHKLLHSSMIHFPLNSGVSSLNRHEYGMEYISTASISFL